MQPIRLRFKSIKALFIFIVIVAFCSFYFLRQFKADFYSSQSNVVYSIIIDAGSTGSRIHVFKLNHRRISNKLNLIFSNNAEFLRIFEKKGHDATKFDIKLENEELFIKIKPGLSSYANEPEKAADSIKPLLDRALIVIPENHHPITKISLKATAGLRLISDQIANKILSNIKKLFSKYPFLNKEDVSILDGKFEGIYSWLTLNYALKSFQISRESQTVSLDLGGGSTQVTFVPTESITLITSNKADLVDFKLDQSVYKIFAKSYLGFGLMSARMNIFKFDVLKLIKTSFNKSNYELFSVCLPVNHKSTWVYQEIEYTLLGPDIKEHHSFEKCTFNVVKTIENKFNAPVELRNKEIYAFSYYFDRLNSAKVFNSSSGGKIIIQDILEKAISICDNQNGVENSNIDKTDKEYHFLCMDTTYIYYLLTVGYGLPNDKEINLYEISVT